MGARGRPERREKSAWKSMVSRGNRICKDMGLSPRLYLSSPFLNEQRGRQDNNGGGLHVPSGGQAWGVLSSVFEELPEFGLTLC